MSDIIIDDSIIDNFSLLIENQNEFTFDAIIPKEESKIMNDYIHLSLSSIQE